MDEQIISPTSQMAEVKYQQVLSPQTGIRPWFPEICHLRSASNIMLRTCCIYNLQSKVLIKIPYLMYAYKQFCLWLNE